MYDFCSLILNTPITWIQTNFYSGSPLLGMTDNGFLTYTATEFTQVYLSIMLPKKEMFIFWCFYYQKSQ